MYSLFGVFAVGVKCVVASGIMYWYVSGQLAMGAFLSMSCSSCWNCSMCGPLQNLKRFGVRGAGIFECYVECCL